eukprot:6470045-Amphidinium_carterae.1
MVSANVSVRRCFFVADNATPRRTCNLVLVERSAQKASARRRFDLTLQLSNRLNADGIFVVACLKVLSCVEGPLDSVRVVV